MFGRGLNKQSLENILMQHLIVIRILRYVMNSYNSFMNEVPIICRANQWTGFYIIGITIVKDLMNNSA